MRRTRFERLASPRCESGAARYLGLALAGLLTLTACDQWALSVGGNGLLLIGVIGDDQAGRFRGRARETEGATRILDVPASGQLSLSGLSPGTVELTLLLPSGCQVAGANPQTLMVSPDQAAHAAFDVRCSP